MGIKILHNPKCSKSRQTLKILEDKGIHPEIKLYLESPPTKEELGRVVSQLGIQPQDLIRFKEKVAKERNLSPKDNRPASEWIALMNQYPILIERPIVIKDNKAILGRPPENVLSLL